jgi:hypothetical protein
MTRESLKNEDKKSSLSCGGPRSISAIKKKLEDPNCINLQQWKKAILKVWLERIE